MLTLDDLVANGSVSADGAEILQGIGAAGSSFIVYSLPRNAGKSTVTEAILACGPPSMARHDFLGTPDEAAALTEHAADGWLCVAEMGHRGRPGYLAEDEIVRAFEVARHGYALATSLHADTVDGLYEVLAGNGVPASEVAATVRFLVKVQPMGDPFAPDCVRFVEAVHEHVAGGGLEQRYAGSAPATGT